MFSLTTKIPNKCTVAVSGGADSLALLHFVSQNRQRSVSAAIFDHGTPTHHNALPYVQALCERLNVNLSIGNITCEKPNRKSMEEHWRDERYKYLDSLDTDVLLGHNLNDNAETYLFSSINGKPKFIPNIRDKYFRPFLSVTHKELEIYCQHHNIEYYDDPSNLDLKYNRTRIRHNIIPEVLKVNPGFFKVVRRMAGEYYG